MFALFYTEIHGGGTEVMFALFYTEIHGGGTEFHGGQQINILYILNTGVLIST